VRQAQLDQSRAEAEMISENVTRRETEIGQRREELSEREQEISHAQQQGLELKAETGAAPEPHPVQRGPDARLAAQNARATSDIAQAEERKLVAEQELAQVSQRLAASAAAVRAQQRALQTKGEALQAVENQLRGAQESLREAQAEAFSAAQQLSRARNEIVSLDLQKEGNAVRPGKTFGGKGAVGRGAQRPGGAAATILRERGSGDFERAGASRHAGGTAAASGRDPGGAEPGDGGPGRTAAPAGGNPFAAPGVEQLTRSGKDSGPGRFRP